MIQFIIILIALAIGVKLARDFNIKNYYLQKFGMAALLYWIVEPVFLAVGFASINVAGVFTTQIVQSIIIGYVIYTALFFVKS
jgi:hypothetical protein